MTSVAAWVLCPLVLYLIAVGLGLLGERAARIELPDALLAPVGGCLAIVVSVVVLKLGGAGAALGISLAGLALAGLVVARDRSWRRLLPGWAGIAGLLALALYLAPVVLSGHWNWLGYNFVNDTANNFLTAEHIKDHGLHPLGGEVSTRWSVVNATISQSYPLGAHGLVAAVDWLVPAPVEAIYQPLIASLAALAAIAFAWLARSLGLPGPLTALAGSLAIGTNLTYNYALHGAFKELAMVMVLVTAAAVARLVLDRQMPVGAVVLLSACLGAGVGIFSAGAVVYGVALGAAMLLAAALERPPQRLEVVVRSAGIAAVLAIAVSPFWLDAISFSRAASAVFADSGQDLSAPLASPAVLGHLARPLPLYESLGIWLRDDYRYPIAPGFAATLTTVLLVGAGLLVAWAVVAEGLRRRLGVLLVLAPALLVYLLSQPRLEPYAEAKLLVVAAPALVFAAALGAWWLYQRVRIAGLVAALALVGGVVVSDAMSYREARLAPVDRMAALRDVADRSSGRVLLPEWEEFAKHFGAGAALDAGSESSSPRPVVLRDPAQPIFHRSFDLDEMRLDYVLEWPEIILRRSPENSRPPVGYELAYRNAFYELWKRGDGSAVREHLPLQSYGQPAAAPRCSDVMAMARRARRYDQRLVAATRGTMPTLGMTAPPILGAVSRDKIPGWYPDADVPGGVVANGKGRVTGGLDAPAGRYRVWVKGSTGGRPLTVKVDGHSAGTVKQLNTPNQWLEYGTLELDGGRHAVEASRPGGGLEPGNGVDGLLVAIALERQAPRPLVDVAPADARRLCGRTWDWIERVTR